MDGVNFPKTAMKRDGNVSIEVVGFLKRELSYFEKYDVDCVKNLYFFRFLSDFITFKNIHF